MTKQKDGVMAELTREDYLSFVPDTGTPIEPAQVIDDGDGAQWDATCDMLVVGLGLAGASAALKGAELGGLDIVVVDRFTGGGTSSLSGGVVYTGGGTHAQHACGIVDTVDNLTEYMTHEAGQVRQASTIRRFAERSPGVIDWLEGRGTTFGGPLEKRKTSYPPADKFLYYSGNEVAPTYATSGGPAPRGHRAIPQRQEDFSKFSGAILMEALQRTIEADQAIRFWAQTVARRLFTDPSGRVVGVELWQLPPGSPAAAEHAKVYRDSKPTKNIIKTLLSNIPKKWRKMAALERENARPIRLRVRKGVVLATGGFGNNPGLMKAAAPVYFGNPTAGQAGDDGSAVRLGVSVGAALGQMQRCSPWRFIAPPISWMKGVLVDAQGQRIVNEQLYGANVGTAIMEKAGGKAWLITDRPLQDAALHELKDKSLWPFQRLPSKFKALRAKKGKTLAELEIKLGFPAGSLQKTLGDYNLAIREARVDAFGKSDEQRCLLETGPFYAMNESRDATLNPMGQITLGGIDVDEDTGQALGHDGRPIVGLYAAGRSAVGLCSQNYVSGMSLADGIFSGWTAADHIAGNRASAA
jgi:3-oxo-5alpha-steroid 4-dehydrogenase